MEEIVEVAKMKIRVLKCSQPTFWYNNKIGQEFSVIEVSGRDYYVNTDKGSTFGVLVIDAELIN